MSLALLTTFHSPRVESSFSVMDEVMDKNSGRMNASTYFAIQTVKYSLNAKHLTLLDQSLFKYFKGQTD